MKGLDQATAIYGGRFDPPHLGHIAIAEELIHLHGVKSCRIIPSLGSHLKPSKTEPQHRLKMAQLSFAQLPRTMVDTMEIERGTPSYSYETISELKRSHPQLVFILGTDQVLDLHRWHRFPEILKFCKWLILRRKGTDPARADREVEQWISAGLLERDSIQIVETKAPEISSSTLREGIARGGIHEENAFKWLKPEVAHYIRSEKLYGCN